MLEGQIALVTGAGRGIGAAIALELGKNGATVICADMVGAQQITQTLQQAGVKGLGMELDVNNAEQIGVVLKTIADQFGDVTILVNNAGITRDMLLMRMSEKEWDDVMSTNLKSVFRLSQAVLRPMMKARGGRIISISSVVGAMGNAGQVNYAASKAGLVGFSKSLAREVGSRGITVNCVAPGFIDTDMTRALSQEQRSALLQHIPLGRLGQADEVAKAVAFLASPHASYITGETLHVNGGMYMS
jgi:3-oxoacyl-[acyl-carrier protein] reductase